MLWFSHAWMTSFQTCAIETRKWATWSPSGSWSPFTFHACAVPQAWQVVAIRAGAASGTRCGMAKESQAQPPHHSVVLLLTEKPKSRVANGCARTIPPPA
jgi:hypothetical protein